MPLFAVEISVEKDGKKYELGIGGYGGFVGGQIINGTGIKAELDHRWLQNPYFAILLETTINDRLQIILNGEFLELFSYLADEALVGKEHEMGQFWNMYGFYLRQTRFKYHFGNPDVFSVTVNAGKWHYKYNPEVRDLGEYLFRGSSYPTHYETKFDDPSYPLLGAMVTTEFNNKIINPKLDLILTNETAKYPMQDWSLAAVASINIGNFWENGHILSIGGGFCFDRLMPADENFTTPEYGKPGLENVYYADTTYTFIEVDPVTWDSIFDTSITDVRRYSFQSQKASFRFTLDPKVIFPLDFGPQDHFFRFLSEDDFKFYFELGILGLEDYPNDYVDTKNGSHPEDTAKYNSHFYDDIKERMPYVFGITLPCFPFFHIFDVFAFEYEFFPHTYMLGYEDSFRKGWPKATEKDVDYVQSYWSLYGKKTVGDFTFVTLFARNHYRPHVNSFNFMERNDVLVEWNDWCWLAKLEYRF